MKYLLRVLCCFLLCAPLVCAAADSPSQLVKSLKGKVVFLRGMESGDKLNFDAQGKLIGTDAQGAFAFSALKINKIHRAGATLEVKGEREAMFFDTKSQSPALSDIQYVPLHETVQITITLDAAHPESVDAAFEKVFALSPESDLADTSPAEEIADLDTLGTTAPIPNPKWNMLTRDSEAHVYSSGCGGLAPKTDSCSPTGLHR